MTPSDHPIALPEDPETCFFVTQGSPVWLAAWRALGFALFESGLGTGADLEQECDGEVWQYLCSELETEQETERSYFVHEFRHRFHPITLRREYLKVVTDIHDAA